MRDDDLKGTTRPFRTGRVVPAAILERGPEIPAAGVHESETWPGNFLKDSSYVKGAKDVLPLAIVIGIMGVLFGYLARTAGLSPIAAITMSATTLAGSAQFTAVAIIGQGGSPLAAVMAAALLNMRYLIMGLTLAGDLKGSVLKRVLISQLAVDESWAVAYEGEGRFNAHRLVGAGCVLLVFHVATTAIGASGRADVVDPRIWGLDVAFPVLFLSLLWPHLADRTGRLAAGLAAGIALVLTPFTPPGFPILAAAAAAIIGWSSA